MKQESNLQNLTGTIFEDLKDGAAVTIPESMLEYILSKMMPVPGSMYTELNRMLKEADDVGHGTAETEIRNYENAITLMRGYLQLCKLATAQVESAPRSKFPLTRAEKALEAL